MFHLIIVSRIFDPIFCVCQPAWKLCYVLTEAAEAPCLAQVFTGYYGRCATSQKFKCCNCFETHRNCMKLWYLWWVLELKVHNTEMILLRLSSGFQLFFPEIGSFLRFQFANDQVVARISEGHLDALIERQWGSRTPSDYHSLAQHCLLGSLISSHTDCDIWLVVQKWNMIRAFLRHVWKLLRTMMLSGEDGKASIGCEFRSAP